MIPPRSRPRQVPYKKISWPPAILGLLLPNLMLSTGKLPERRVSRTPVAASFLSLTTGKQQKERGGRHAYDPQDVAPFSMRKRVYKIMITFCMPIAIRIRQYPLHKLYYATEYAHQKRELKNNLLNTSGFSMK